MNEKIEKSIRMKSNERCVFCHREQVKCYILDEKESDEEDNYILLCDMCAIKYIGNKDLVKQLKPRRDYWYKQVKEAGNHNKDILKLMEPERIDSDALTRRGVALYHVVYENEGLKEVTKDIYEIFIYCSRKSSEPSNSIISGY